MTNGRMMNVTGKKSGERIHGHVKREGKSRGYSIFGICGTKNDMWRDKQAGVGGG